MPLSESGMSSEMQANIATAMGRSPENPAELKKITDAISKTVCAHILANLTITFVPGDIPVSVSVGTGIGANTTHAPLSGKVT